MSPQSSSSKSEINSTHEPLSESTAVPRRPLILIPGLRPSFYPLKNPERMYSMSIDNLDLGDTVRLDDFDDGTLDGLKRWNQEHESLIDWLYDPRGRCLVDARYQYEHCRYLADSCCAPRNRGVESLANNADSINALLNADLFKEEVVDPWLALTRSEQEKVLLEALAQLDRSDPSNSECFARNRKLLPEIIIADLLLDGGGGLVKLFDYLATHIPEGADLPEHPIYNERFFKKFGIPLVQDELPLPESDRAFHQEYLMRRHSLLFTVVEVFVHQIIGQPHPTFRAAVGNWRSELTRSNDPELADKPPSIDDETLQGGFECVVDELCNTCHKTAGQAGLKRLLHCESCKKVDRIEPYCSKECQVRGWKSHKAKHCGTRVSAFAKVPIIVPHSASTSPSATAHLPRLRRLIRRSLDKAQFQDEFWTFNSASYGLGYLSQDDAKQTIRIRQAMRALAFEALETADQAPVGLLAFCLFNVGTETHTMLKKGKKEKKFGPADNTQEAWGARETEFRKAFELENEEDWKATLAKGREEVAKSENKAVKEYYDFLLEQALEQRAHHIEALCPPDSADMPLSISQLHKMMWNKLLGPLERVPLDEFSHWRAIFPTIGNDEYQNHGDEDEEEDLAVGEH